jgi:hypothetical protein
MSRHELLNDKILIDVTHLAKQIYFDYPVAITAGLYLHTNRNLGIVWELLNLLYFKIKREQIDGKAFYETTLGKFVAVCEPDDEGKPALTIMLPNEVLCIKDLKS